MGNVIIIVGRPSTGKSTSYCPIPELEIKGLDPKSTFVIETSEMKFPPFKGWKKFYKDIKEDPKGNFATISDAEVIAKLLNHINDNRNDINNIVIDDAQFIMSFEYMARAKEINYNKFIDIGVGMYKIIQKASKLPKDKNLFMLWHSEIDKKGEYKMKTIGEMIDKYLTPDGLVTAVLYSKVSIDENNRVVYSFVTNNDGEYPARSPFGMFPEIYIKNDLGLVLDHITEYNN